MDFVRPNYKTIADGFYEEGEKRRTEETARRMLAQNEPMEKSSHTQTFPRNRSKRSRNNLYRV